MDVTTFTLVICCVVLGAALCACIYIRFIIWHTNKKLIQSRRLRVVPARENTLPVAIATNSNIHSNSRPVATIVVMANPL